MKQNVCYSLGDLALILLLTFFSSCVIVDSSITDSDKEQVTSQERTAESIALEEQTKLLLEGKNGGISIVGSDTTRKMHLTITKKVKSDDLEDATAHLRDISVIKRVDADKVDITVEHPSAGKRSYTVDFDIVLPKAFDFEIQMGNGSLSLYSVSGSLALQLGNGSLKLDEMETDRLDVDMGNGDVDADVVLGNDCVVEVRLGNGEIVLEIPRDSNVEVGATVGNGTISSAGLNFRSLESSKSRLKGVLGDGTGDIVLALGNGVIELRGK